MEIENIIKVMNFHSLLRVDFARKNAEKYFEYEKELNNFADNILNNRNLILDKKMLKFDSSKKPLHIYIANDLGFCGSFNTNVNEIEEFLPKLDLILVMSVYPGESGQTFIKSVLYKIDILDKLRKN